MKLNISDQMVNVTNRYYEDEESYIRRYNGRGHGYPLSQLDRDLPPGPSHGPYGGHRLHHHPSHDGLRGNEHLDQDIHTSNPRRRIPVAVSLLIRIPDSASKPVRLKSADI